MNRKNFAATGSFVAEDRPRALDLLGFASQLVFNTFHNRRLRDWEHGDDRDLAIGAARAHNRAMVEFCSVDERLLPSCYVPLADLELAGPLAAEAIAMGAAALLVASGCPPTHSPSHVGLDPVWAAASEARIPIVFHVGGTGDLIDPNYFRNGLPVPPDFHGGEENFRSVDYMAIPGPPAQTLATMIFDGVLERFPDLRIGVIEQGADLGAVVDAPDGVGLRRLRPPRGAPAGAVAAPERVRPPPGPLHALPDRGRRVDHRPGRDQRCACSPRTTPTSRAGGARSSASRDPSTACPTQHGRPSTTTTSST